MSLRLSILALSLVGFLMLSLLNVGKIDFRFFFAQMKVPLFFIMTLSTLFGVIITYIFISLGSREKKLQAKVRDYERAMYGYRGRGASSQSSASASSSTQQ